MLRQDAIMSLLYEITVDFDSIKGLPPLASSKWSSGDTVLITLCCEELM